MAKNLEKLLGESLQARIALGELRQMTGDDSDVRLIADILARGHSIVRRLGLIQAIRQRSKCIRRSWR